jgi:hypothetical protein
VACVAAKTRQRKKGVLSVYHQSADTCAEYGRIFMEQFAERLAHHHAFKPASRTDLSTWKIIDAYPSLGIPIFIHHLLIILQYGVRQTTWQCGMMTSYAPGRQVAYPALHIAYRVRRRGDVSRHMQAAMHYDNAPPTSTAGFASSVDSTKSFTLHYLEKKKPTW